MAPSVLRFPLLCAMIPVLLISGPIQLLILIPGPIFNLRSIVHVPILVNMHLCLITFALVIKDAIIQVSRG